MTSSAAKDMRFHSSSISGYGAPVIKLSIVGERKMAGEASVVDIAAGKVPAADTASRQAFERINPAQSEPAKRKPSLIKKYGLIIACGVAVVFGMAAYDYYQTFQSKGASEIASSPSKSAINAPTKQPKINTANNVVDIQPVQEATETQLAPQAESLEVAPTNGVGKSSDLTNADMEAAQRLLNGSDSATAQLESKSSSASQEIRIDNIETLGRDTATQVSAILPEITKISDRLSKQEADTLANKKAITQLSQVVSNTTRDMEKVKTEIGSAKQQLEVLDKKIENLSMQIDPLVRGQSQSPNKAKTVSPEKRNAVEQPATEAKKSKEIASNVPQELTELKLVAVQGSKAVIKILKSGESALIEVGQSYKNLGKVEQVREAEVLGHSEDGILWSIK